MSEKSADATTEIDIPYASAHAATHGHRVFAGAAVLIGGLGLGVVGGCFLIGVMLISTHGFNSTAAGTSLSTSAVVLISVLYVLAAVSFVAAALVFLAGLRGLFKVLRG